MQTRAAKQNRISVWTGARDRSPTKRTSPATDILNDYGAKVWFQLFSKRPTDGIEHAARWKGNNEPDRPCRIGLRPCEARDGRQRCSARGQMQKLPSVGKFHGDDPSSAFSKKIARQTPPQRNISA